LFKLKTGIIYLCIFEIEVKFGAVTDGIRFGQRNYLFEIEEGNYTGNRKMLGCLEAIYPACNFSNIDFHLGVDQTFKIDNFGCLWTVSNVDRETFGHFKLTVEVHSSQKWFSTSNVCLAASQWGDLRQQ